MRKALLLPLVFALPLALTACDDGSERIGELERELETQRTSLESSQAEVTTFRSDAEGAKNELEAANARLAELEAASDERDAARADLEATQADMEGIRAQLDAANARIGDLEAELRSTSENARATMASLGQRVNAQVQDLQALAEQVADDTGLSATVTSLQENAESLGREIEAAAAD